MTVWQVCTGCTVPTLLLFSTRSPTTAAVAAADLAAEQAAGHGADDEAADAALGRP
ncbi:MAG: hypothetical protein MO853_01695 [Candidatus Protistobacter heckmanni]|nr:hypothetical protein [Candidatus Protistobacter heckmanni]